jgi:hypothetical protein
MAEEDEEREAEQGVRRVTSGGGVHRKLAMPDRLRSFFARYPVVREALLWALPAIAFGAVLRLLLLSYLPYAYWGSDSRSYFSFAHMLLEKGYVSLDEKRRYLYPILLVPVSALPGAPLRWLAWFQHGLGLATIVPLAYVMRKTLAHWRWWIVPVTLVWSGMPMVLWYEHELLGENVFFAAIVWAIAGWCAWVNEARLARAQRLFWWFFVPFGLFLITKPSGRFVWPGVCLGLVLVAAWRKLNWRLWAALAALVLVTLTVGSKKQAAWLLYVATFPLTRLETPLHADYKAEIRDLVEPLRSEIDTYYLRDQVPFTFLENPGKQEARPLWKELDTDAKKKARIYLDLAIEGIKARPDLFLHLALQRVVASANLSEFKEERFTPEYYPARVEHHYEQAIEEVANGKPSAVRAAFALPKAGPLPPWPEFRQRLSPRPDSFAARAILGWVRGFEAVADVVRIPESKDLRERALRHIRPTLLGVWLLAGAGLSLLPAYRKTLGVWMFVALSYLLGVFLVSQPNPRYFGPAWAMLVPLFAVPMDTVARRIRPPRS